jgi:glycosyltransferase involved in cell wall biosynthesis
MPPPSSRFCALIPSYNLARTISQVVRRTQLHLPDVLVIDDGSTDDTARRAVESGATVLKVTANGGKGWALRHGFRHVLKGHWEGIITLDGDLQHDPDDIPRLISAYEGSGADIVVGSRMRKADKMPRLRYYTNRVGVFCISWAAGQPLEDSQSGFRFYRRRVIESIPLRTTRYDTETEIVIKAGLKGMKIISIPIKTIYYQGDDMVSHYRPFTDTFHISMVFLKSLFWRKGIRL